MCPNSKLKKDAVDVMSKTLFLKIIKEIVKENLSHTHIQFYLQNEPFMDNDILNKIRITKELSKNKIRIELVTNGTLLSDRIIKELRNIDIDIFVISLDAYTNKTYDKIRQGLDFSSVLKNIDNLLKQDYPGRIYVGFVKQKDNISELQEFKKHWKSVGYKFKKNVIPFFSVLTNRSGDLYNYNRISIQKKNAKLKRIQYRFFNKINPCYIPFLYFNILSNGDVILCLNDYAKKMILGNVETSSIKEIWNSAQYNKIRHLLYNRKFHSISVCENCSHFIN